MLTEGPTSMFSGVTPPSGTAIVPMTVRSRMLSLATILLVFAVVATSIFGFIHVSTQQQALTQLRRQSQELRMLYQSLVEAEAGVLHVLGGETAALPGLYARLELLESRSMAVAGQLGDIVAPGGTGALPASALIDSLGATWLEAVELAAAEPVRAHALLASRQTSDTVGAVGAAIERVVTNADTAFAGYDERIRIGTLFVLLLQVGGGTLALLGLIYAFRSSVSEADGRAAAVASADASREQVARLFEMADVLQSATDHSDANAVLKSTAAELVPGFSGALYVFNNARDRLVLSTAWGRPSGEKLTEMINPADCWALKRGKPHFNRGDGTKLCCAHHQTGETTLEMPMMARGEVVGLLQVFARGDDALVRLEGIIHLCSAMADGMSLALANMALREKLRNQALRDPLTGLYNRRYMEDSLQRFVRLAERESRDISLLMVDLDHFKRLNDEHGHAFGDQVLRESAMTLLGSLRETDIVCRYGGEELVVILPDCPFDRAVDKAETLRLKIEEMGKTLKAEVTASFGVSSLPAAAASVPDLLASADAALYKAKQAGRNQVARAGARPSRFDRPPEAGEAEEARSDSHFLRTAAE